MNMNSKRYFLALLSLFGIGCMQAQIDVDDEGMDGDDDEITVTEKEDHEEEVDFPEAMTFNLDSLLQLYHSRNYLEDGDCQMGNENPSFPTEVYIDRLRRLPTVMEMAHNEVVQAHIDRYTGRMRRSVSYMLGAANFYLPIFEDALDAYQLPLELKYLPIIESALKPTAVSRVGAAGLWQFMPSTGKKYGLTVKDRKAHV
jgi:membrane-bound lytic murein transglycosylase D